MEETVYVDEVWVPLKGIVENGDNYAVSNFGNVMNLKKFEYLKPREDSHGYLQVNLCKNGESKPHSVHRLAALAFISNPQNKAEVNHIDGDKHNNSVENLEWNTPKENMDHALDTGLHAHPKKPIAQLDKDGNLFKIFESVHEAERQTGINNGNISKAANGKLKTSGGYKWKFITKEEFEQLKTKGY